MNQTYDRNYSHNLYMSNVSLAPNTTVTHPSSQCLLLKLGDFVPWDNPDSLVSVHTENLVRVVKVTVALPVLFLIGGPANIINMAVFAKQGLKERINVCLFALSLADFLVLVSNMVIYGEQIYTQFAAKQRIGPFTRFLTNNNLAGISGFKFVSQVISAIIACERCFCILQPLRSQTVLRTSTTVVIIVIDYVTAMGAFILVMARYRVMCVYEPVIQDYIWTVVFADFYFKYQVPIDFLNSVVFGTFFPVIVTAVVTATTTITAVKLRESAAWRARSSSRAALSSGEMALTKMLVCNSIFFVGCVLPTALVSLMWQCFPEINPGKTQHNLYFTLIWLLDILTYANATFNIVIYYIMGSRFRQTFWRLFCRTLSGCRDERHNESRNTTIITES